MHFFFGSLAMPSFNGTLIRIQRYGLLASGSRRQSDLSNPWGGDLIALSTKAGRVFGETWLFLQILMGVLNARERVAVGQDRGRKRTPYSGTAYLAS